MDGHADRACLVGERSRHRLLDPPSGVRRELEAHAMVELLGGAYEADRPLLDQIEERQALVPVLLRDRDDQAEVRLHHLLFRTVVAALDALRELDLLGGGKKVDLADVLQEQLQRVRRKLSRAFTGRTPRGRVPASLCCRGGGHCEWLRVRRTARATLAPRPPPDSRRISASSPRIAHCASRIAASASACPCPRRASSSGA